VGYLDGPAAKAWFDLPSGVAVDASGKVYVADQYNNRIRVIAGGQVTTLAGTGDVGYLDGPAAKAWFDLPSGVAVDASGKVYVADQYNNRIRVINP
jgi:DNA-binding beta-propeller fold protein YncE